jgi:transcriptional regulator with XRE-family HTH domain
MYRLVSELYDIERGTVALNGIGGPLKAARERLGWSREALAYHSGVSWSAIAQIESGRRTDVRLSSLSALAAALDVSVDYLTGTPARTQPFDHRVLTYGSDDEFTAAAVPFLAEGIERSDGLLAVATKPKIGLLRDSLGDNAKYVEFADWADWYRSPSAVLNRYRDFVAQKREAGVPWIRVVGEAGWSGLTDAEVATWTRYESLVNLAFASSPATIVCTYDEQAFPVEVIAEARRTHPVITHGTDTTANSAYREPEDYLLDV